MNALKESAEQNQAFETRTDWVRQVWLTFLRVTAQKSADFVTATCDLPLAT